MAKLSAVLAEWMETNRLDASAIQCWTSVQQNYGINVCTAMSMMSEKMMPSACEVDVTGVLTTDDAQGTIRAYVGEGELSDDPLATFGNRAVAVVPRLQKLMHHVCKNGFEHHVVMNRSHTAGVLSEAFGNYLDWDVCYHERPEE